MDHFNVLIILAGLLLGVIVGISYACWSRQSHYQLGWNDAATGHRNTIREHLQHVQALQADIGQLHKASATMTEAHRLDREALLRDADRRIAIYSRRANPLGTGDINVLLSMTKTLQLAARTWSAMPGAVAAASSATRAASQALDIIRKVERALIAAGQLDIQPAAVLRAPDGYWDHPHLPAFDPDDASGEMLSWLQEQRLQTAYDIFEDWAPDDHPYIQTGTGSISDWQPQPPAGEGWFLLSIYETEDNGPVAMYGRREVPEPLEAAA